MIHAMRLGMILLLMVACAARGELLVSSFNNNQVLRFDPATGAFLGTLVSNAVVLAPHETVFAFDRALYVASANNDRVLRVSPASGDVLATLPTIGVPLDYPAGMTLGEDGLLYVSSQLNDSVLRYDATNGAFLDTFVAPGSGGLDGPSGLAFGPDGDLYVAGRFADRVFRYSGADGAFLDIFVTNALSQPFGLRFGPDGHLYVANGNSNHVARFDGSSGAFLGIFTSGGALSLPIGLAFGPDTNLYVASFGGDTVARFDGHTGAYLGNAMAAGAGGLDGPNFITFRPEPRAAPLDAPALVTDGGTNYFGVRLWKGTNTGPVAVQAEWAPDLVADAWFGGTNIVVIEDSHAVFRARDALPAEDAPRRFFRVRLLPP